jgi:hypothetical protein
MEMDNKTFSLICLRIAGDLDPRVIFAKRQSPPCSGRRQMARGDTRPPNVNLYKMDSSPLEGETLAILCVRQ